MRHSCALEDAPARVDLAMLHLEGRVGPLTADAAIAPLWALCDGEAQSQRACAGIAHRLTPIQGAPGIGAPATRSPRRLMAP